MLVMTRPQVCGLSPNFLLLSVLNLLGVENAQSDMSVITDNQMPSILCLFCGAEVNAAHLWGFFVGPQWFSLFHVRFSAGRRREYTSSLFAMALRTWTCSWNWRKSGL
jgi:hypothetical protein